MLHKYDKRTRDVSRRFFIFINFSFLYFGQLIYSCFVWLPLYPRRAHRMIV